jgi:lipoprotein-anchoring transpeptidase ErfK/SrfK
MARYYFSRKYYNAPMPHAIFFDYGFAIHGTNDISRLGGPASHGCVRLHPANAATLFALVEHNGPRNTRIESSNQSEGGLLTVR